MNVANILTLLRLALAPVFAWLLYTSQWLPAFVAFLIAIITDMMDGYLARRLHEETAIGKFLDPLADKIFFMSAMIVLMVKYALPGYYLLALTRDIVVGLGAFWVIAKTKERKALEFPASLWGKATTTAQAVTIGAILLPFFGIQVTHRVTDFFVLVTFILSIISIGHYATACIKKGYI
ncbi:CDP-alcohol phosphatidyltransferase family protein [Candidatus Woesearchaeota archaeon]|nr:CDP-alcohol phosphatidyltransferase family protein [Candidatus Woesearchaeota archaeon]